MPTNLLFDSRFRVWGPGMDLDADDDNQIVEMIESDIQDALDNLRHFLYTKYPKAGLVIGTEV